MGVESHVFRNGGVYVMTLLSNPLQRVDELGPPDFRSNKRFETPVHVTAQIACAGVRCTMLERARLWDKGRLLTSTVRPYEPVILVVSRRPFPTAGSVRSGGVRSGVHGSKSVSRRRRHPGRITFITSMYLDPKGHVCFNTPTNSSQAGDMRASHAAALKRPGGRVDRSYS